MNSNSQTRVSLTLCYVWLLAFVPASKTHATTDIGHDDLNRIATVAESANAGRAFLYDPSGNRTNYSVTLSFSVVNFASQQIAADAPLSLPLATAGALPTESAGWIVRSSNRQLVPKSGIQVVGAGTVSPTVEIIPASGEIGTTRITIIASDGEVATATSFVLSVGSNQSPRAINDSAQHPPGEGMKVEKRKLLANDSDPDGDLCTMTSVSLTSAHGGQVSFLGPFVAYEPPLGYDGPDFLNYTITDSHGASAIATVTLKAQAPTVNIPSTVVATVVLPNNHRLLTFIGVPNLIYQIQASTDLISWTLLGVSPADSRGRYLFEDSDAELYPVRYYRSVFP